MGGRGTITGKPTALPLLKAGLRLQSCSLRLPPHGVHTPGEKGRGQVSVSLGMIWM